MPKHKLKPHRTPRPNRRDLLRYRKFAEAFSAFGSPTFQVAMSSAIAAGYTESYARSYGSKLCDRPGVQKEMERIRHLRLKRSTIMSPEELLETLTTEARTLPNELVDGAGKILPLHQMSRQQAHAIAGVEYKTSASSDGEKVQETVKYKLIDRQKSKEMLMKFHGLYKVDNEQQKDETPRVLVAFPSGPMSLEAWQEQAVAILKAQKEAGASGP
jgi:phage terminase small subunit